MFRIQITLVVKHAINSLKRTDSESLLQELDHTGCIRAD